MSCEDSKSLAQPSRVTVFDNLYPCLFMVLRIQSLKLRFSLHLTPDYVILGRVFVLEIADDYVGTAV